MKPVSILVINILLTSAAGNKTVDQECLDCVLNGSFAFYKRIHWPNHPATYACRKPCDAFSSLDWTVAKFCSVDECKEVENHPTTTILENLECKNKTTHSKTLQDQPIQFNHFTAGFIYTTNLISLCLLVIIYFNIVVLLTPICAGIRQAIQKAVKTIIDMYRNCPTCGTELAYDVVG